MLTSKIIDDRLSNLTKKSAEAGVPQDFETYLSEMRKSSPTERGINSALSPETPGEDTPGFELPSREEMEALLKRLSGPEGRMGKALGGTVGGGVLGALAGGEGNRLPASLAGQVAGGLGGYYSDEIAQGAKSVADIIRERLGKLSKKSSEPLSKIAAGWASELAGTYTSVALPALIGSIVGGKMDPNNYYAPADGAAIGAGLGGLATAIGQGSALLTPTRNTEDQAEHDANSSALANLLVPGVASHNSMKRLGYSIRNPDLKKEVRKAKGKGPTAEEERIAELTKQLEQLRNQA